MTVEPKKMEPVAIVGAAGRWAGANNLNELSEMLFAGRTGKSVVPDHTYNIKSFYHPDKDRPGGIPMKEGYFLRDCRKFDNAFFGINPVETKTMDPDQRQLLEVAYECLESAGITLETIAETSTGVFVGSGGSDYPLGRYQDTDHGTAKPYGATGSAQTMSSNRLSYVFDLNGPSVTVDTACSSSIYALHLACNSLLAGDCTAALVGGINLIIGPYTQLDVAKLGVLSPTSTCHTFDAATDGYARAEGCGVLFIKLLKDAIKDKDPIRAVIRGTAVNSNGKNSGITHPSSESQEYVIKEAYVRAGISDLSQTAFFECHATGTAVGDPIEVEAVGRVFRSWRKNDDPLSIGSIKSNIGHSEAACGIAHVLKAIIILESESIPPTVGVTRLNPKIDFEGNRVNVITKTTKLEPRDGVLLVSVNNSGFGGANAHVVMESVKSFLPNYKATNKPSLWAADKIPQTNSHEKKKRIESMLKRESFLLTFSAHSKASLQLNIDQIKVRADKYSPEDLAFTLGARRTHFHYRAFATVTADVDYNTSFENIRYGTVQHQEPKIGFVFTGQGAQWPQMGLALMNEFPIFLLSIQQLDRYLQQLETPPTWTIEGLTASLREPESSSKVLKSAGVGQTVCTAIQISLVNFLSTWNITAVASVGHSSGEIAAAYSAGKLTERQAIIVAYYRGLVAETASNDGAMLAVGLGLDEVSPFLRPGVTVGCVNSHRSVTLTGDKTTVEQVHAQLQEEKIFSRLLRTGGKAYHSEHMKKVGGEYQRLIETELGSGGLASTGPTAMISSVNGKTIKYEIPSSYWRRNLESPVLFDQAITGMIKEFNITHAIEIGPHSALQGPLKHILQRLGSQSIGYLFSMSRGERTPQAIMDLTGQLYIQGYPVALELLNSQVTLGPPGGPLDITDPHTLTDLPGYSWEHRLWWEENRVSHEYRNRSYPRHELLGSRLPFGGGTELMWRNVLRPRDIKWLGDHKKHEQVVFPAAGYLAMAIEAISQVTEYKRLEKDGNFGGYFLKEVSFIAPLNLDDEGREILFTLSATRISVAKRSKNWYDFSILSISPTAGKIGDWTEHCTGSISFENDRKILGENIENPHIWAIPDDIRSKDADPNEFYDMAAENNGTTYGPRFRLLRDVAWNKTLQQLTGQAVILPDNGTDRYIIHPTTLDIGFQVTSSAAVKCKPKNLVPEVPTFILSLNIFSRNQNLEPSEEEERALLRCTAREVGVRGVTGEWVIECPDQTRVVCEGIKFVRYSRQFTGKEKFPYYRLLWRPDISKLNDSSAKHFLSQNKTKNTGIDQELISLLDLYVHKNPAIRILQIGGSETNITLAILAIDDQHDIKNEGVTIYKDLEDLEREESELFDLVIIPELQNLNSTSSEEVIVQAIKRNLTNSTSIIIPTTISQKIQSYFSGAVSQQFQTSNFSLLHKASEGKQGVDLNAQSKQVVLVYPDGISHSTLGLELEKTMISFGWTVLHISSLAASTDLAPGSNVISLVDIERPTPVLENIDDTNLEAIKKLTHTSIIWLTNGNIMDRSDPATALMFGLTRSIVAEEPNLRFRLLDFDQNELKNQIGQCVGLICEQAEELFFGPQSRTIVGLEDIRPEREFAVKEGTVFISRYVPDMLENERWNTEHNSHGYKPELVQREIGDISVKMKLQEIGQLDSLCFYTEDTEVPLSPDEVEFRVTAATINPKGVVILLGIFEPDQPAGDKPYHSSFEHAGTVLRVGKNIVDIHPGDTVVSCWSGDYGTVERVPAIACQKIAANDAIKAVTMPVAYMTALYAFNHLARLQKNESVLIHSAAGPVGFAAIQIASQIGAKIYVTVSTGKKRDFVHQKFGIPYDQIFQSRDRSFVRNIKDATLSRGVDVILSAHTGDLLHDTWECLAVFGRYVDIGRRDVLDNGRLNMNMFARHASFFSFDLGIIGWQKPELFQSLFTEVFEKYRAGEIEPIDPITVFDVSQLSTALRTYTRGEHMGKMVIDYSNPRSCVPCQPTKREEVAFKKDATYLMVGGLGGLGQSLIKWMFDHGARNFVFLSRSGNKDGSASNTLKIIHNAGGSASVVEGSVTEMQDCLKAIGAATHPIKGVIHAAMVLKDGLFSQSTAEEFNKVVNPKHIGALNLHNALIDYDLDFFLMMSSISAATGPLVQPNYTAANASLENLARLRHHQGLPAATVALGAIAKVGILGKYHELIAQLIRVGIIPLTESEYLQAIEVGIRSQIQKPSPAQTSISGTQDFIQPDDPFVLTGLELGQLQEMYENGQYQNLSFRRDPRFALIVNAVTTNYTPQAATSSGDLLQGLIACKPADRLPLMTAYILGMLSDTLMRPVEQISPEKSAYTYGLDSLVGGELRLWVYHVFKVDISFLEISEPGRSIIELSEMILSRRKWGDE